MSRARIAVIGANSFVGKRIVRMLQDSDWAEAVLPAARTREAGALREVLQSCAGVVNATMGAPHNISAAATALYGAIDARTAPRIVHLSSMTVYGNEAGVFSETAELPTDLDPYPAAHRDAELLARRFDDAVILRPGCEYGPDCPPWSGRVAQWLLRRRLGDLGIGGDGYCNLIFIDDLLTAVLSALRSRKPPGQIFNVSMAAPPTWNAYLIAYAIALGAVPVRRVTRRRWSIETRLLAPPLKIAELAATRISLGALIPPAIPPSFKRLCTQEIRLDVERAERHLGLAWTPLATGLAAAAAWYSAR